jgi:hypothetical protein
LKLRADEHIAPKIVRAIQSLVLPDGWELTHVRDLHKARTADETWVPQFVSEKGRGILSADRKMLARPHQIRAIKDGELIGVFFSHEFAEAKRHQQAALVLWWWPKIQTAFTLSAEGTCWRVPYDFTENATLEDVTPSYEKAIVAAKT